MGAAGCGAGALLGSRRAESWSVRQTDKCSLALPHTNTNARAHPAPPRQVAPGTVIGEEEALAAAALAAGEDSVGVKGFATIDQVGAGLCC